VLGYVSLSYASLCYATLHRVRLDYVIMIMGHLIMPSVHPIKLYYKYILYPNGCICVNLTCWLNCWLCQTKSGLLLQPVMQRGWVRPQHLYKALPFSPTPPASSPARLQQNKQQQSTRHPPARHAHGSTQRSVGPDGVSVFTVAEDSSAETQSVRRPWTHVLHQPVFHLL